MKRNGALVRDPEIAAHRFCGGGATGAGVHDPSWQSLLLYQSRIYCLDQPGKRCETAA